MPYQTIPGSSARFFLNDALMADVDHGTLQQVRNTLKVPSVEHVCVLPDCHSGYGAPIGSVVVSQDNVLPGPVGYDIGCGMAVYTTNVPAEALKSRELRRKVISSVDRGIAMGAGKKATHGFNVGASARCACGGGGAEGHEPARLARLHRRCDQPRRDDGLLGGPVPQHLQALGARQPFRREASPSPFP